MDCLLRDISIFADIVVQAGDCRPDPTLCAFRLWVNFKVKALLRREVLFHSCKLIASIVSQPYQNLKSSTNN